VSPSWREHWVAVLSPERVALVRRGRGWRAIPEMHAQRECTDATPAAALDALRLLLAQQDVRRGALTLLLSSHFVQYLLVPWRAGLTRPTELTTFAHMCFEETFGGAAGERSLMVARERAGSARVAAALDRAWLGALKSAASASALRLVSVQPYLCALFDRAQRRLESRDFLLLVAEPARSCVLVASGGQWCSLRCTATPARRRELVQLVEREAQLCGLADDAMPPVFLHAPGQQGLDLPACHGVHPQRLEVAGLRADVDDALLGMAEAVA
jgi:hypothetical protein